MIWWMQLTSLTPSQLPALEILARQCFTETFGRLYSPEDLEHHLSTTCSAEYLAESLAQGDTVLVLTGEDGTLAGYAKYGAVGLPLPAPPHPDDREIHRLYIAAAYHGQQLGARLIEAMLNDPAMQRAPAIYLSVWSGNHRAQRFYHHYGFRHAGDYTYYVGNHADDEYIFRRQRDFHCLLPAE